MDPFNLSPIDAIVQVPGLYISDITVPNSSSLLRQHNITHVLSLTNARNCPKIDIQTMGIRHLHVDIEDNPMEDLLICLDGLCAWIAHALVSDIPNETAEASTNNQEDEIADKERKPCQPKVLVHCIQGISRSGAVVVAYIMRSLSLSYDDALGVVRKYRGAVTPNSGFAEQIRIWKALNCSIFLVSKDGNDLVGIIKQEYRDWKGNRGVLLSTVEIEKEKERAKKPKRFDCKAWKACL